MCPLTYKQKNSFKLAWDNDARVKPLEILFYDFSLNLIKSEREKHKSWINSMEAIVKERQFLISKIYNNPRDVSNKLKILKPEFIRLLR